MRDKQEIVALVSTFLVFGLISRRIKLRKAQRRKMDEQTAEEAQIEQALRMVEALSDLDGKHISLEETDNFTNQVAGHTNEKMLTHRNLVLKPIIKPLYFHRELTLYVFCSMFFLLSLL